MCHVVDTWGIAPEQAKRVTREQYAANHPAGRIGKRLTLRVKDVMVSGDSLPTVAPDTATAEVLSVLSAQGQARQRAPPT